MTDRVTYEIHTIHEGDTSPLNYQLQSPSGSDHDLTGMTVAAEVVDKRGQPVSLTVAVVTAGEGKVKITRTATTFLAKHSPYRGVFVVTDGSSEDLSWPSGNRQLQWNVINP